MSGDLACRFDHGLHHGYRHISVPKKLRHLSGGKTKIAEHRFVMAQHLGASPDLRRVVHHINGKRTDNRLENLELWSTSHPSRQRVEDLLAYSLTILAQYGEEYGVIGK